MGNGGRGGQSPRRWGLGKAGPPGKMSVRSFGVGQVGEPAPVQDLCVTFRMQRCRCAARPPARHSCLPACLLARVLPFLPSWPSISHCLQLRFYRRTSPRTASIRGIVRLHTFKRERGREGGRERRRAGKRVGAGAGERLREEREREGEREVLPLATDPMHTPPGSFLPDRSAAILCARFRRSHSMCCISALPFSVERGGLEKCNTRLQLSRDFLVPKIDEMFRVSDQNRTPRESDNLNLLC